MKKYFVVCWSLFASIGLVAQDYNFSQFYELPLLRNPALAGVFDCNLRLKSVYRSQWQSVTVPYQTGSMSAEIKTPLSRNGDWNTFGVMASYDVAGDSRLKRIHLLPFYTLHKRIGEQQYISGGVMAGPVSSNFDPSKLTWDDQFVNGVFLPTNPTAQQIRTSKRNYLDVAAGIAYNAEIVEMVDMYIGASVYHANRPVVGFDPAKNTRMERRYGFNAGLTMPSGTLNALTFYTDLFVQGGHAQAMMGGLYTFGLSEQYYGDVNNSNLHIGGMYRWNDAFIPVIKLDVSNFSFGLSYDVNISKLSTASQSRGGFELTLTYRNCAFGSEWSKAQPCPSFGR